MLHTCDNVQYTVLYKAAGCECEGAGWGVGGETTLGGDICNAQLLLHLDRTTPSPPQEEKLGVVED